VVARKVFQDFAHVLCQRFIEVPSNRDLVNLALLGSGELVMDIMIGKATFNRYPIQPLPYAADARLWIEQQLEARAISPSEIVSVLLAVTYTVELQRKWQDFPILSATFEFSVKGMIGAPDRQYLSSMEAKKAWGLSQV
jgi:hypothetical protein